MINLKIDYNKPYYFKFNNYFGFRNEQSYQYILELVFEYFFEFSIINKYVAITFYNYSNGDIEIIFVYFYTKEMLL